VEERKHEMKAIRTYYLGATNFKGSRVKATDEDGHSVTLSCAKSSHNNHQDAAVALARKMHWSGTLIGGELLKCMVWVWSLKSESVRV